MLWESPVSRENAMQTKNPLVLALLMSAGTASAQFPTPNPLAPAAPTTRSFNFASVQNDPDWIFKCSTPPYIACTAEEDARRNNILRSAQCPQPVSQACTKFLMEEATKHPGMFGGNPISSISPEGETLPSYRYCGTVPYRNCTPDELAQREAWQRGQNPENAPAPNDAVILDEIVVTAPRRNDKPQEAPLPPAFPADTFQRELADARSCTVLPVVDLGDNRYGVVDDNGGVKVCGLGQCDAQARPGSQFPNLAELVQAANSNPMFGMNSGIFSLNRDNPQGDPRPKVEPTPTGFSTLGNNKSTPPAPPPGSPSARVNDEPPAPAPVDVTRTSARDLGRGFGTDLTSSGYNGAPTVASASTPGADEGQPYIAIAGDVAAAEAVKSGFTYIGNINAEKKFKAVAGEVRFDTDKSAEPTAAMNVGDGKYLGKTQASENVPQP